MSFVTEKFEEFDGLILGAPVYFLAPPGYLKVLTDRMISREINATIGAAKRGERKRPVGLISVGGGNESWTPMGVSLMKLLTFTEFATIDQLHVTEAARPAQILLDERIIEKGRLLGRPCRRRRSGPRPPVRFENCRGKRLVSPAGSRAGKHHALQRQSPLCDGGRDDRWLQDQRSPCLTMWA